MKITTFKSPSTRFRPQKGKPGKKCRMPPVSRVGRTMKRKTDMPTPSTTARATTALSSFLLERCFSSHSSNLEGFAASSSG